MIERPVKYNKLQGTQPSDYVSFSMDGIEGKTYMTTSGYDKGVLNDGLYSDIPLYFPSDPTSKDYALIDGIPTPMDETAPHMGAAYKDDKSVYYPSIGTTFNSSLTLNVTNYPHSGTLTADGLITLSGNNRKLCTAADGLTLQATGSNLLTLSGINTPTNNKAGDKNKLIIDGHVFLSGNSSIASGAAVNQSGIAVYYCKTSIQTGQVTGITYGGASTINYTQQGTDLYLWLPAGSQQLRITTDAGIIYTVTVPVTAQASTPTSQSITVYATEFDISKSSVALATVTGSNQAVTYNNGSYSSPGNTPLTITGTTRTNSITLGGTGVSYVTLKTLSIESVSSSLQINNGAIITVDGVCSLTGDNAILTGNNTVTLTGKTGGGSNTLTVKGATKDISNASTLTVSGALTLNSVNGTFSPANVIITDNPVINIQGKQRFLTYFLTSAVDNVNSLSTVKYTTSGTPDVSTYLYTNDAQVDKFYFWMTNPSEAMRLKTATSEYSLASQTGIVHNKPLTVAPLPVAIGATLYESLAQAFAAAANGDIITLRTDLTLPANTTATLSLLAAGHAATLQTGAYTLTAGSSSTLAAGLGTLKLDISGSGSMKGTYALTGSVYTISDGAKLGSFTRSDKLGTPVFRVLINGLPTSGLPTIGTLQYQTGTGTTYPARYENGQTCLWVPSGQQKTTIKDASEPISSVTTNLNGHSSTTAVAAWPVLDIANGDIEVNGNSVTYGSKRYVQSVTGLSGAKPFQITGTSSSLKKVTTTGTTYIDLNGLTITNPTGTSAFTVSGGTAHVAVTGTNSLTGATNNHGINVASGATLNLSGTGTLTASGPGTGQDINNLGTMNLSGTLTLKAANSRFKPTATISSGTPTIQLGQAGGSYVTHYRSYFTAAEVGNPASLASVKYKSPAITDVPADLYTSTPSDSKFWFWTPATTRLMQVTTNLSSLIYVVPSQTVTAHGKNLSIGPMPVAIGGDSYESLDAAFAAAVNGNVITLTANLTLPANTRAQLSKLSAGQAVTLQTGAYTLTAGTNCTLSAGNGTLKLDINGARALKGTYTLQGYVYSASEADKLNEATFKQGDVTVFRTIADKLSTGLTGPMAATTADGTQLSAWYDTSAKNACLWLPTGQQTVTLGDVLSTSVEPIATLTAAISGHSTSVLPTRPRVDVAYADVVVVAATGSNTVVTYGGKRYAATLTDITANNRLPLYGTTTKYQIAVSGAATAYLSLQSVNIQTQAAAKPALVLTGPADIELYKSNLLRGGYDGSQAFPAVKLSSTLTLRNDAQGTGQLFAYGGRIGSAMQPAVQTEGAGKLIVEGGTLLARHGDDTQTNALSGTAPQIKAGSVDALSGIRPTNGTAPVYKVAITTGLEPGQVYTYQYKGKTTQTFPVMPDNDGKIYCWLPAQPPSTETAVVTLVHPTTFEKKEIEIVKVDENDNNVAPTVLEMREGAGPAISFGNLKDAFDAMQAGTAERPSVYTLKLLTNINNLRTLQEVPLNTHATLDVGSTNIGAQNGTEVAFDASANGAFLRITGKGNIKNSFRIAGDVFIDGVVPLTDAVVELNKKAVFRTLVKDLPSGKENSYTYSYGQQQNIPFNLHDGQACLWLPDYGRSEELRFVVSGSSGLSTEYTAGNITTVTQRTEAIPANPVGVTARLSYRDTESGPEVSQAFNTLQGAFDAAGKATGKFGTTVSLLTGVSISGTLKASGTFTLSLDGKNITSASGGLLEVADRCRMLVADQTAGMKGALQTDVELKGDGQLFVPSSIQMKGNVKRSSKFLWRTLLNMSSMPTTVTKVEYQGNSYPVIAREVCLWLPENNASSTVYQFTIAGQAEPEKVSGYMIMAHHNNDMIMGSKSTNEARIGTKDEPTLAGAFTNALDDQTIELLKNIQLTAEIATAKKLKLELGKYTIDPINPPATEQPIRITAGGQLSVESRTSTGQFRTALVLDGGLLYMGQSMNGSNIGQVTNKADASKPLYRLLVTNLPAAIPPGTFDFTYGEDAGKVTGKFIVQGNIACLWLPQSAPRKLTFTVAGGAYETQNVMINADHFNTETYGVSDVAQIRNGNKYASLTAAFAAASGKTLVLLKNAALTEHVTIAGNVTLETGSYSIMAQAVGPNSATFTVPVGANLQITGKGNITALFNIQPATTTVGNGNGNLQVGEGVTLNSNILMNGDPVYRTVVKGLPAGIQTVTYIYGSGESEQKADVLTAGDGTLYLWIKRLSSTPQNFFVETPTQSYLATSVVITDAHNNPITVTPVSALAGIGDATFDTLDKAFEAARNGDDILLRKDASSLTGTHTLPDATTGVVTLNLQENTITATSATFDANKGHLLLTNGSLTGTLALTDNVYAGGDVMMNNATVSKDSRTVWRTLLALPQVTPIISEFSYKLGTTGTSVKCTNIQTVDDRQVACLWLPSSSAAQALTVEAGSKVYTLTNVTIASTHGNELDATDNNPAAAIGEKEYASLAAALAAVKTAGETITLKKDLALSSLQSIQETVTLNMEGRSFTSNYGGFEVSEGKTLTLTGGQLLGTIRLPGKGQVNADKSVKIAGIILNNEADEVFRALVKVNTDTRCLWIISAEVEQDQEIEVTPDTYEVTLPAHLSNHNTTLTAYKRVTLTAADAEWKDEYANTNVVLTSTAIWNVGNAPATGAALHRLTINDGAKVKTGAAQVLAADGIRYIRSFAAKEIWQSIALPYTATRITAHLTVKEADGKEVEKLSALVPASGSGTAGHFWLRTIQSDGSTQNVTTSEMTANMAYIMAVPEALSGKPITFVSAPNQLLRRDKVLAVKPVKGFAAYANGALDAVTIGEPCYILTPDGKLFKREATYTVLPFRGYLLADAATTAAMPEIRMDVVTDVPQITDRSDLRVYTEGRYIILEATRPEPVWIYSFNGYCLRSFIAPAGRTAIEAGDGFYLVNRTKVVVRSHY